MSETPHGRVEPVFIEDSEALRALLEAHGFDTTQWGEGPTKTVAALWGEVEAGESELVTIGEELVRRTRVAAVDVLVCPADGRTRQLYEDRQVFRNGSERRRDLMTSLAEKIRPDEDTEVAVRRAIAEELGITGPITVELGGEEVFAKKSATFDGILTQLALSFATVEIDFADYNPDGYVEQQDDKSVYFKWKLLDEN